jgi:SAM-dependent methyltransferase
VGEYRVIACEPCGFTHITPIPTAFELEEVYRTELYGTEKPDYLERHRADLEWWNLVYRERYETFEEHLGAGRRRILDVGSGPGFFLLHGKERGWDTLGIEPSVQASAHARELGLSIVEGFLDDESAPELGRFDVLHMNNVLEHVPDPRRMLELSHDRLAPDGLVCIAVPNDYSPFQHVLREVCEYEPWWVVPPHHINYFDAPSLARLLERTGFEVVRQEGSFPIDLFLLMGDDYVGNGELGRACHEKRMAFETRLDEAGQGPLKRELYAKLAELGLGRQVLTFARRR